MKLDPQAGDARPQVSQLRVRRRRLPHPHEQRRREEWGRAWGQMVRNATQTTTEAG